MVSELRALLNVLNKSVDAIEASCNARGVSFPSLDQPRTAEGEAVRMHPDVIQHATIITTAAYQLFCTARPPPVASFAIGTAGVMSSCLRVATETHTIEILREAGPKGLHVNEIASRTKTPINAAKLGRILRYLATHHIFKEVSPNVFANNLISSIFDKGDSVAKLIENPNEIYGENSGDAALFNTNADEGFKGLSYLYETLVDPETANSGDPAKAPLPRGLHADKALWQLYEEPEHRFREVRFAAAMRGLTKVMNPPSAILKAYDWANLQKGSVVVDVGSGVGSVSLELAKAHPGLNLVLQDRPSVMEDAVKYWTQTYETAITQMRVTFQPHDFFAVQPVEGPAIFLLRAIVHDWADELAVIILKNLRKAAGPNTQLLTLDAIVPYACADPGITATIPGALRPVPPAPLLPNMGAANTIPYGLDVNMLNFVNGIDRTLGNIVELHEEAGWKVTKVQYNDEAGLTLPSFVSVPI